MADFETNPEADVHENGTIIAAALWELREMMGHPCNTDLLLLKALLLWRDGGHREPRVASDGPKFEPETFARLLDLLLEADDELFSSRHQSLIIDVFSRRGVFREPTACHKPTACHNVLLFRQAL
jgi:hypothetical protein